VESNQRCCLVVLAIEAAGRWSEEAAAFISNLAGARARQAHAILQQIVAAALIARWSATLTHAAMTPFAANLLGKAKPNLYNVPVDFHCRPKQHTWALDFLPFLFLVCLG